MRTRREFLRQSAALALTPIVQLSPFVRSAPPQRIVVLGAGLAGLCAAYELQRLGHHVTVLEAQSRPGGRVRTLRTFAPGVHAEAGAEEIPDAHEITQHYARELGLTLLPNRVPGMRSLYYVSGQRVTDSAGPWPFEMTAEERALGLNGLYKKYIDGAIEKAAPDFPDRVAHGLAPLDAHTVGSWLRAQGASAGATDLIALGFGTDFGSAAAFVLHGLNARGTKPGYRVDDGNDRLPTAFASHVDVRYGAPVVAVRQDDSGVDVIVRALGRPNENLRADRVVCALPCPVIERIFDDARISDAKQHGIREQNYSHTVKVFLQTRTRFWLSQRWSGYVETDLPIERLTPDSGGEPAGHGVLAAYPIGPFAQVLERTSDEERAAAAFEQARKIFPELGDQYEGSVSYCWGTDPWQRGSFALHAPGQIGFIDVLAKPEGRIHFAGEHTSPWTGWMQGALQSARRVVQEING